MVSPGVQQRFVDRHVGVGAAVWLDVRVIGTKERGQVARRARSSTSSMT